ncbi:hypothetical protein CP532_4929 [Ophiocordyceps camponoti-leonardi (nom. inval.)]|nr:hypothetical protein CP532_4929 [Ophiocordyceps camponoti-leonardi (nom. inval.)]
MAIISVPSPDHRGLLDMIDEFRAQAIDRYVSLPELIVTGDECLGKGAILEAITGMAGPLDDERCPRFATELMLRPSPHTRVKASILPDRGRSHEEQDQLRLFDRNVEPADRNLNDVIDAARRAMGLSGDAIGKDVLRVELTGPELPTLTVIDLPCLSPSGNGNGDEGTDQGPDPVNDMVLGYMNRKRSIILAVVSAKSEFSLPKVIRLSREADPDGIRTLGIITEPSRLQNGSESEASYVKLAQNRDVKLRLGWHVLETGDHCDGEDDFFRQMPWTGIDPLHLGITSLKPRLVHVLKYHILHQLPSLAQDVSDGIDGSKERLEKLGSPRGTIRDQRRYLLQISQSFCQLTRAAVDGVYGDDFFGSSRTDEGYRRRLRAVVQNTLTDFAGKMHAQGRSRRIVDGGGGEGDDDDERSLGANEVLRSAYVEEVRQLLHRNRGCELAGTFNPLIVGELFAEQSQPWRAITMTLKDEMVAAVRKTTQAVPYHVAAEETAEKLSEVVNAGIDHLSKVLDAAVEQVLTTYLDIHPITYNGDLLDAVRAVQADRRRRELDARVRREFGRSVLETGNVFSVSGDKLLDLLAAQGGSDEALSASSLAVDYAEAYYTISIKRFIDAISTRAIECQLVQKLPSVLDPEKILLLENDEVTRLAADSEATISERAHHREKVASLDVTLLELKRLDGVRPTASRVGLPVAVEDAAESLVNWPGGGDSSDVERPTRSASAASSSHEAGAEEEQRQPDKDSAPPRDGTEEKKADGEAAKEPQTEGVQAATVEMTPPSDDASKSANDEPSSSSSSAGKTQAVKNEGERGGSAPEVSPLPTTTTTDEKKEEKPREDEISPKGKEAIKVDSPSDKTVTASSPSEAPYYYKTSPLSGTVTPPFLPGETLTMTGAPSGPSFRYVPEKAARGADDGGVGNRKKMMHHRRKGDHHLVPGTGGDVR